MTTVLQVHYCERFLELITDLEALLPTRRFFNTVLDDCHLVVRCQLSNLVNRPEGHLFCQVKFLFILLLIYPSSALNYEGTLKCINNSLYKTESVTGRI